MASGGLRGALAAAAVRVVGVRPAAVRRQIGDREEERLALGSAPADQLDRLVGVDVGRVGRRRRWTVRVLLVRAVLDVLAVLEQLIAVEGVGLLRAVPFRPSRGDPDRAVLVAVQELADVGRVVAGALEPYGQRLGAVEPVEAAQRRRVAEHPVVVGVLAGEEGRPRGTADRPVGDAGRKAGALAADQRVDLRHVAQRVLGLVVAHHHDDVRALALGACGLGRAGSIDAACGHQAHPDQPDQRSNSRDCLPGTPHRTTEPGAGTRVALPSGVSPRTGPRPGRRTCRRPRFASPSSTGSARHLPARGRGGGSRSSSPARPGRTSD